ncbi:glycosyltransferase family 2 protein [Methanolobus sp. ZRKC3]|uniref:glycosyltransferase family 2 protein n=1 Tax=Methanolobus sp. ZRKC3 TaxID=3125786 RepID=UPI00324DE52B
MKYILITPCRNEEKNLQNLANSIISQSIKPLMWVIVDDRSDDNTSSIIKGLEQQNEWIHGLYLKEVGEYMGFHYSRVCNQGFDSAMKYCSENNISYEYIALVDADNIPEVNYFEVLMHELEKDNKLGIISGTNAFIDLDEMKSIDDISAMFDAFDSLEIQYSRDDLPMGSARMWHKQCFEETGGYMPVYAPDAVSTVKAKMKGWNAKRIKNARVIERQAFETQGIWTRSKEIGNYYHYLWHPLSYVLMKSIKYSFERPYYKGVGCLFGYGRSAIGRREKINDVDVKVYYTQVRPKELRSFYIAKFKKMLGDGNNS